jgi:CubicO group peptidase (beta-lactamase class C family)
LADPAPVAAWGRPDDPRRRITLDHLLRMSSGLAFNEDVSDPLHDVTYMLTQVGDMAAYAIDKPLQNEPGRDWHYSSGTTNIISGILRRTVGDASYHGFPRRALFEPLGMRSAVIEPDASGTFVGSSFMYATARDWAKFGQLYLQDGVWDGKRLLPDGWVKYTTTPAPTVSDASYGAHFWLNIPPEYRSAGGSPLPADAFHAVGHEGQFLTIIPSQRLVIVRLGLARYPQAWEHDRFVRLVLQAINE